MSLKNCFARAQRMGIISKDELKELSTRFDQIVADASDMKAARDQMATELQVEAEHRKRAALLSEAARDRIFTALQGYRNHKGEVDKAEAFLMLHENFGRIGSFVEDAEGKRDVIMRKAQGDIGQLLTEFKRGAFTGDRRRQGNWVGSKIVQARMDNVVKELFGESTGDASAKAMAEAWSKVSDELRERFNAAGGAIAKLEGWGLPQSHNRDALLEYGRKNWVDHMMQDGVLDRQKTVHPLSRKPLSDTDLRQALGVAWDRITTDGMIDKEVTATGGGRPALYKQHSDHRFLHFASADAWIRYQKDFGAPDVFATMMGHIGVMARDIAHMEVFGPNPTIMREYVKKTLLADAANLKTKSVIWSENSERMKAILAQIPTPRSEHVAILNRILETMDRITAIHAELSATRRGFRPKDGPGKEAKATLDRLSAELSAKHEELKQLNMQRDDVFFDVMDDVVTHAASAEYQRLLDESMEPPQVVENMKPNDAGDYLRGRIKRADAMWESMRGGAPINHKWADRMATARNLITASSLGAAWFSSLADVSFGQDLRLRLGMGLAQSNAAKVAFTTFREMLMMGSREDAIAAGLGLDSAMHIVQQQARMTGNIDMRGWSGFVADRVLTMGMLQPWTQAGKHIVGLDLMRWMAKLSEHKFMALPDGTQKALKAHGINAQTWDTIRTVPKHEPQAGVTWLRPNEIEATVGKAFAERYQMMILRETRSAVPEGTVESRSVTTSQPAGTLIGEMIRSGGQFKGYGIGIIFLHMRRIARELQAGDKSAAGYAATMLLTGTIVGAVAMALKDMKDGRDPKRMLDEKTWLDPKFWGAAMLQAGGFGIYGDLLFSDVNRHGGGLSKTIAGPMVDRIENVLDIMVGAPLNKLQGKPTKLGANAVKFARSNVPGANLWPIGLMSQRLVFDKLQKMIDPDAQAALRNQVIKRQTDYNQSYYWPPGESAPRRAPNVARIFATR